MQGLVSTGMGIPAWNLNQPPRPTQSSTLSGKVHEYWAKGGDAIQLGSKCMYGSSHLWINVCVAGKTV